MSDDNPNFMFKNKLVKVVLALVLIIPLSAQASVLDDLLTAVNDLQRQVVELLSSRLDIKATSTPANLTTVVDNHLGFAVSFSRDWSTSTVFASDPARKNQVALVRNARVGFLEKMIAENPTSTAVALASQDSVIFFKDAQTDEMYTNPTKFASLISTSTKKIGSTTVDYIFYSNEKTQTIGGSVEKYVFSTSTYQIMIEVNYSEGKPTGVAKKEIDNLLPTFRLIARLPSNLGLASSTDPLATSTDSLLLANVGSALASTTSMGSTTGQTATSSKK